MLDYSNKDNNTFALRALPDYSQLQWGTGSLVPKDGNARYLCFNGQPVIVWIIGGLRGFRTKDYKFKLTYITLTELLSALYLSTASIAS